MNQDAAWMDAVLRAHLSREAGVDVLLVCTGNTCRSPMAEAIMRRLIEERELALTVGSAGLLAESRIAARAARALQRLGIETGERAAVQLTEEMVEDASLVLCMTEEQRRILAETMPDAAERIHAWGCFIARSTEESRPLLDPPSGQEPDSAGVYDVPDPVGQDDAVYEATAATIETLALATLRVLGTPNP